MTLLQRSIAIGIFGYIQESELDQLCDMACGKDVLEVGSFKGLSAWAMAITAKSLLCIDTFCAGGGGQEQENQLTTLDDFLAATSRYDNIEVMVNTSHDASVAPSLEHRTFDLIFIDAMHTYEDVRSDIADWLPKLRPGGIMAFHDYSPGFPGVIQAVNEAFGGPAGNVSSLVWIVKP